MRMAEPKRLIFFLIVFLGGSYRYTAEPASHLQLLKEFPAGIKKGKPVPICIRSDYRGSVYFQEADDFQILINITAPSVEEAYSVHTQLLAYRNSILLQLFEKPLGAHASGLKWVIVTIGCSTLFAMFFALICAACWNKSQGFMDPSRHLMECFDMSSQPMMYRSRNSMYHATQGGDVSLHAEEEADNNHNEDTLKGVPEMPEEEEAEAEALRMEELRKAEAFEATKDLSDDSGGEQNLNEEFAESHYTTLPGRVNLSQAAENRNDDDNDSGNEYSNHSEEANSETSVIEALNHEKKNMASYNQKSNFKIRGKEFRSFQTQGKDGKILNVPMPSKADFQEFQSARPDKRNLATGSQAAAEESTVLVTAAEVHGIHAAAKSDRGKSNQVLAQRSQKSEGKDSPSKLQFKTSETPGAYSDVLVKDYAQILNPNLAQGSYVALDPLSPGDNISMLSDSGQSASFHGSADIFENDSQKMFQATAEVDVDTPAVETVNFGSDSGQMFPMPNLEDLQPASSITSAASKAASGSWMTSGTRAQPRFATFRPLSSTNKVSSFSGNPHVSASESESAQSQNLGDEANGGTPLGNQSKGNSRPYPGATPPRVPPNYQNIQNEGSGMSAQERPGVSRKPPLGTKHVHLAIVSSLCFLSLAIGVYSLGYPTETEIIITVFAPQNLLANSTAIYFGTNKSDELKIIGLPLKVTWYEMEKPILVNIESTLCELTWCEQGCDENTGRCICRKGYRLDYNGKCVDVNECLQGRVKCHRYAGCLNTRGSYQCICTGDYYGDGQSCLECSSPCQSGMFEVQPCSDKQQKICKECTKKCAEGYYMYRQCGATFDAVCRMCESPCNTSEYEYWQCMGDQNRQCKDKSELPTVQASSNVLVEDRSKVKDLHQEVRYLPEMEWKYENAFFMSRGSNVGVRVRVKKLDPVHKFVPVDHSRVNDNQAFYDRGILRKYCPYPLSAYYQLQYEIHKGITYEMDRGLNTNDQLLPCRGYKPTGNFPELRQPDHSSLLCAKIGPLAKMFGIEESLTEMTTVRVEKSISCERMHQACENCTKQCAGQMSLYNTECQVTGDEADNGWSPRLRVCYTCCVHNRCSSVCDRYHSSPCRPKMCVKGSVLEFMLKPVFTDIMYCHVVPTPQKNLLEVEFNIIYHGQRLRKESFHVDSNQDWLRYGEIDVNHKFLDMIISSGLQTIPNIVSKDQTTQSLKAGTYKKSRLNLSGSVVHSHSLYVHPQEVFGVSLQSWALQNCSQDVLEQLMAVSENDEPYIPLKEILALHVQDNTYIVTNKTVPPKISFRISKMESVMKWVAPPGRLIYDSLEGSVQHSSSRWVVMLKGQLESCPGFLSLNLSDTTYYGQPLFQYDFVVECPPTFDLTFSIPTSDQIHVEKAFTTSIRDSNVTYHLTVHQPERPAQQQSQKIQNDYSARGDQSGGEEQQYFSKSESFFVPFVASICGAVLLLLFMAGFGIMTKQGCLDANEVSLFNQRHLIVSVFYFTFQVFYSLLITLSAFSIILWAVNSDTVMFLKQYQQLSIVKASLTQLELNDMKKHLLTELNRQSRVANQTKIMCETKMKKIAADLNMLKLNMTREAKDIMAKNNISELIRNHTRLVVEEFTDKIVAYRERTNVYTQIVQKRLVFDVQQTYQSVLNNKWLAGAKYLHDYIVRIRSHRHTHSLPIRPFTEWMDLYPNITNLADGLTLILPSLPSFDDIFKDLSQRNIAPKQQVNKSETTYNHNFWFYPRQQKFWEQRNVSESVQKGTKQKTKDDRDLYYIFLCTMIAIDIMWFLNRMVNVMRTTRLLLYGYPVYVDCRENKEHGLPSVDNAHRKANTCCKPSKVKCCSLLGKFFSKVLKTMFIPKMIVGLLVALLLYMTSTVNERLFRRRTFQALGYYTDITDLLELSRADVNSRIQVHSTQINTMEYPLLEEWMNSYLKRHLYIYDVYKNSVQKMTKTHSITYCEYLQKFLPDTKCVAQGLTEYKPEVSGCKFPPIEPGLYERINSEHSRVAARQMDSFLYAVRKIVSDTCFIVLLYLSFIVVWDLTSTVVWLYVKRAGLIRLRVICETDEKPMVRDK